MFMRYHETTAFQSNKLQGYKSLLCVIKCLHIKLNLLLMASCINISMQTNLTLRMQINTTHKLWLHCFILEKENIFRLEMNIFVTTKRLPFNFSEFL